MLTANEEARLRQLLTAAPALVAAARRSAEPLQLQPPPRQFITVGTTAPANPQVNDVWIDTN